VVEIVGLQLSLPLGSMYNPADALIQRCLMDQDLFLDVIDFTLRICAAQGLSASAGRLRLTLALAGSAWTGPQRRRRAGAAGRPDLRRCGRNGGRGRDDAGQQRRGAVAATWRAAYGRHPDPSTALAQAIKAVSPPRHRS